MSVMRNAALACTLLLACAACSKPEPPPTEHPPEPQAADAGIAAVPAAVTHTDLRDAIQRPIDRAKAVEDVVHDAAEQQRAAIEAQAGD
jgi:hypothetical protein